MMFFAIISTTKWMAYIHRCYSNFISYETAVAVTSDRVYIIFTITYWGVYYNELLALFDFNAHFEYKTLFILNNDNARNKIIIYV